jgi:NAD(P)-dependent dehydrogenase (short-subunit alcohol dehydrogenase family)
MSDVGTIVVTGASRGLGAAICDALAQRGALVVGLSRSGGGPAAVSMKCDIGDELQVRAVFAEIAAAHGPITGLVNNAGIHLSGRSADFTTADFEELLRTNTIATFVACREVYPHLVSTGSGVIVNIGSFWDRLGVARQAGYAASKAAVAAMTRCLAVEWARDGIRVLDIAPGYVLTDMNTEYLSSDRGREMLARRNPLARAASPDEVARVVSLVMTEPIAYLTGETIYVDAGQSISW